MNAILIQLIVNVLSIDSFFCGAQKKRDAVVYLIEYIFHRQIVTTVFCERIGASNKGGR